MFRIFRIFQKKSLQQRAENAINVFRNTITKLERINEKALLDQDRFNKEAQEALDRSKEMSTLVTDNSKIINKIKNIIG